MERETGPQFRVTQRKGDTAVAQAIATFTKFGADVLYPITESAAYDLVVDLGNKLYRVQVKYCSGTEVGLRRIHSNSTGYVIKKIRQNAFDWLYVLNTSGKEYLVTKDLSGRNSITTKPEYEIEDVLSKLVL